MANKVKTKSDRAKNSSRHRSFRITKKGKQTKPQKLKSSFRLHLESFKFFKKHWKVMTGLIAIHLALRGIFGILPTIRYREVFDTEKLLDGDVAVEDIPIENVPFIDSSRSALETNWEQIILVIVGLATIWAIRQLGGGEKVKIKESFYNGMSQLVPAILYFLIMILQLIPFAVGAFIFTVAVQGGVTVSTLENWGFALVWALLAVPTFYWLSASISGIFVVTLPGVKPIEALKVSSEMVLSRRTGVMRRVFILGLTQLAFWGAILILFIRLELLQAALVVTVLAPVITLTFSLIYFYLLYKNLIETANAKKRSRKKN